MLKMDKRNPIAEYIENELNMEDLDELAIERARRRQAAIDELLNCLEELKKLLSGYSPYGRIPPKDGRD